MLRKALNHTCSKNHLPLATLRIIPVRLSLCNSTRSFTACTPAMTPMEPSPAVKAKKLINFLRGWPSAHTLPSELLKSASNRVLSNSDIFVPGLQYGPDPGFQPLREELAQLLSGYYDTKPDPERICITGGASQSIANLLQSFTEPVFTKAVWAVTPVYYLACPIFEDAGFKGRLKAVPEDKEGIDLEFLETGLKAFQDKLDPTEEPVFKDPQDTARKLYRHVIYVVPTSANPSGKTMTYKRRLDLVQLARKYNCLIICDDVYDFLQWPVVDAANTSSKPLPRTKPLPLLADIDFQLGPSLHDTARSDGKWFGHAISNGSFSKIIAPGMRTGWVQGTRDFAHGTAQTGASKSGGAPSHFSATVIYEMMRNGDVARHIDGTCRPDLQRRHALLMGAIHKKLDKFGIDVLDGNVGEDGKVTYGGYFVWITFLHGPAAKDIAQRAMEDENLLVPAGSTFSVKGDDQAVDLENCVRLCYSWEDDKDLLEGIDRLERVIDSLQSGRSHASQGQDLKRRQLDKFA
ncbi:pyridoxal phosphate-dependent transferase [Coniella lustricola]|uniref:Pyridoxal phosphate-dependent transferase n=1 Tax=Coniella lustricola TaxID=2025994 RepID=A0A2T3ABR5_9PEZI|nr:pyridoxal phosphate-dependent transferase [Coniella lustricola]